ncbi:hypothetical protein BT93_L2172 [Corymbia citriodora subsp. variegata]|uniref:Uncharacterized protein n=1 Tax=Corymbia citriodora subsp. variegata TaxID=360336 RepID=A0A8T0CN61_CORYI|nr:hypothetical protein BT93_L2172 [Corymbia citriodora subsp. variegata]
MVDLQVISKFAIIFTFIAFDVILTSEGRSIKSAWEDEHRAINYNPMHKQALQFLTPSQSPTNDDHSDAGEEMVPLPTAHDQAANLGESEAVYKDHFHPTPPGSSPGVGHSFMGLKKEAVRPKAPSEDEERLIVTGTPDDFEGARGHSPGVGHVFQNEEPKA